jgi:hypothetical protein
MPGESAVLYYVDVMDGQLIKQQWGDVSPVHVESIEDDYGKMGLRFWYARVNSAN